MMKTLLGGVAVAFLVVLVVGGAAGAATVPVPGVGSIEVDNNGALSSVTVTTDSAGTAALVTNTGSGVTSCAGVASPDVPSGSLQACAVDAANPVGQPVEEVIVNNAGNEVLAGLDPPVVAVCSAASGCTGLSGGGLGGLGNLG